MKRLFLKNFKCFKEEDIYFENLTVLTGSNGAGKSSVIQALLILAQTYKKFEISTPETYYINDMYCELGNSSKLLFKDTDDDYIQFKFYDKDNNYNSFKLESDKKNKSILKLIDDIETNNEDIIENRSLAFLEYFDFICAERYGPKNFHHSKGALSPINVGKHGEYTVSVLNTFSDEQLEVPLAKKEGSSTLLTHVNYWLEKIFGYVKVTTEFIDDANVGILKIKNDKYGYELNPENMPFGISYTLPIIVSCLVRLIDKERLIDNHIHDELDNEMVVIENPEAHLHPSAQSMMGVFLSYIANNGVQIIIETHSDHLINGIRKAVKKDILKPSNVIFNFFESIDDPDSDIKISFENKIIKDDEGRESVVSIEDQTSNVGVSKSISRLIQINEDGELEEWPEGFFDQFEKDMMDLL